MATISSAYGSSSNLTVTSLHSLAASQTWIGGWGSATIDNTSTLALDYLVSTKFTIASSNNQAGQITIGVGALLDDSNYFAVSSGTVGTEGALAFVDTEERDAAIVPARVLAVDTSTAAVIYGAPFSVASLFGGVCPKKFVIFIANNATTTTTAGFASSGNQVTLTSYSNTVA